MLVWNDIAKYTQQYNNGIKKLGNIEQSINQIDNKLKTKHKYNTQPIVDDYGLDDKYTIRPFNIKTDPYTKEIFTNKTKTSNLLNNRSKLSSGTIEAIKTQSKYVPKVNHSYIDPQYYEFKLQNKSNNDLILNKLTKGREFAGSYVESLKLKGLTMPPKILEGLKTKGMTMDEIEVQREEEEEGIDDETRGNINKLSGGLTIEPLMENIQAPHKIREWIEGKAAIKHYNEDQAIKTIQKIARGNIARENVSNLKYVNNLEKLNEIEKKKNISATNIQKIARGISSRKRENETKRVLSEKPILEEEFSEDESKVDEKEQIQKGNIPDLKTIQGKIDYIDLVMLEDVDPKEKFSKTNIYYDFTKQALDNLNIKIPNNIKTITVIKKLSDKKAELEKHLQEAKAVKSKDYVPPKKMKKKAVETKMAEDNI